MFFEKSLHLGMFSAKVRLKIQFQLKIYILIFKFIMPNIPRKNGIVISSEIFKLGFLMWNGTSKFYFSVVSIIIDLHRN